jgi:hypothetical protein
MALRRADRFETCDNLVVNRFRGAEKRAGTEHIAGEGSTEELNVTSPTNNKHVYWYERDDNEQFVFIIDPDATADNRLEVFDVSDGTKQTVNWTNGAGGEDPRTYINSGSTNPTVRYRLTSIVDFTYLVNRTIQTGFSGSAQTYTDAATSGNIRDDGNPNHHNSWGDFPRPPSAAQVSANEKFFAIDADFGHPSGWWEAISAAQEPQYQRATAEGANSEIDIDKWPIEIEYTGSTFEVGFPTWIDRYVGDSIFNPGPGIATNTKKIKDVTFFQNRIWTVGDEFVDSSQAGDVLNMWKEDIVLTTDADPINVTLYGNTADVIDYAVPFSTGLVMITKAGQIYELRADGAFTPSSVSLVPAVKAKPERRTHPAKLGPGLYFGVSRNQFTLVYEYIFNEAASSNVARSTMQHCEEYVPKKIERIAVSEENNMIFCLSNGDTNAIYVGTFDWEGQEKIQESWTRYVLDTDNVILGLHVFGNQLYILIRRNSLIWLEKMDIDQPDNSSNGDGTLPFAVRMDRQMSLQGSYDATTNVTTWTLPMADSSIDTVVLGKGWDTATQDRAGKTVGNLSRPTTTTITTPGNFATNDEGPNALAFVGRSFDATLPFSEIMARAEQGQPPLYGKVQLADVSIRVADTGYVRLEVTPSGDRLPNTPKTEYLYSAIGLTDLGSDWSFPEDGEFSGKIMASAEDTTISLINDTAYPSKIVGAEFRGRFLPNKRNVTRFNS